MVWKLSLMLILLANLNLADLLTTKLGVANGCVEMNPIAANLLNCFDEIFNVVNHDFYCSL